MSKHHFYASSVATWMTTNETRTLRDLIKAMDAEKLSYSLWFVPLPWNSDYQIRSFAPQVPGAIEVEFTHFSKGKIIKTTEPA